MRRLTAIAWFTLAALLLLASSVNAVSPPSRRTVLSGIQGWTQQNSVVDFNFVRNGGSCTINRKLVPCLVHLTNTNSTGGLARNRDGTYTSFAANLVRLTDNGVLSEKAATDVLTTHANVRDWTQAEWVASNMTVALNATGILNDANSASTLTATAGNATVLQTPGLASNTRTFSFSIKCVICTGAIQGTIDGSAFTTLSSAVCFGGTGSGASLSTGSWVRCSLTASVVPIVGIKIVNNGDSVVVDWAQLEATSYPTSPIPLASATRSKDAIVISSVVTAAIGKTGNYTVYCEAYRRAYTALDRGCVSILDDGTSANYALLAVTNGDGANNLVLVGSAIQSNIQLGGANTGAIKIVGTFVANDFAISESAKTVGNDTSGTMPAGTQAHLGENSASANQWNDFIRRFWVVRTRMPDAQLQALSTQ
jgi:hypothetical protein